MVPANSRFRIADLAVPNASLAASRMLTSAPGFEFRHPRAQSGVVANKRRKRFRLRQNQANKRFLVQRLKGFVVHPQLESVRDSRVKFPPRTPNQGR